MRRASSASSFSPLRLFTPSQLLLCLILFFLPWIELQCVPPKSLLKDVPKEKLEATRKETGVDLTKPMSMIYQSGAQIAIGDASVSSDFKKLANKDKGKDKDKDKKPAQGGDFNFNFDADTTVKKNKEEGGTAPLLFVYPVALVAGIVLGFVLGPGLPRRFILLGCCLGAFGIVGLQAAIGFPMERELKKSTDQLKNLGAGAKGDTKAEMEMFRVSWQIPLYLTFLLLLGAAGTSFLDGAAPPSRYKRRYGHDEDDDDEDDRPRRRRRREEDEEEEERPRRQKQKVYSLDDDEEEEPPPPPPPPPRPARPTPAPAAPASDNPFDFSTDDEPRSRRSRRRDEDDDEYDRPRRRRRDDDDDDRPRRRRRDDD